MSKTTTKLASAMAGAAMALTAAATQAGDINNQSEFEGSQAQAASTANGGNAKASGGSTDINIVGLAGIGVSLGQIAQCGGADGIGLTASAAGFGAGITSSESRPNGVPIIEFAPLVFKDATGLKDGVKNLEKEGLTLSGAATATLTCIWIEVQRIREHRKEMNTHERQITHIENSYDLLKDQQARFCNYEDVIAGTVAAQNQAACNSTYMDARALVRTSAEDDFPGLKLPTFVNQTIAPFEPQ